MPGFHYNVMGIGEFCDTDCKDLFSKTTVHIFDNKGDPVITFWRENNGPKLWNIYLLTNEDDSPVRNNLKRPR